MATKREKEEVNQRISAMVGTHRDSWRIGMIEGFCAAIRVIDEDKEDAEGYSDPVNVMFDALVKEGIRRFGIDFEDEMTRRGL
jgi:hypothetical protein